MPRPVVRLSKELKDAQVDTDPDVRLELFDAMNPHHLPVSSQRAATSSGEPNLFTWVATLAGPKDTPFEGGQYRLLLRIPQDYPMRPPTAAFITKVFHPNVNFADGVVCLDILKSRWSPAWTLNALCRAVLSLLAEPEPSSPFNCDAGNLVRAGDVEGYTSLVRLYAILDANAPPFAAGE